MSAAEGLAAALVETVDCEVAKVGTFFCALMSHEPKSHEQHPELSGCHIQAFELEKELSREGREARALALRFRDQTAGWVVAARRGDAVMRDFGDHETFLQAIQDDMAEVAMLVQQLCQVGGLDMAS